MIQHVVLMRFLDPADAVTAKPLLEALPAQIPELLSIWVGLDLVRSEASYELALTTTHTSLATLKDYQEHLVHQEFLSWLKPRLASRVVVDAEL